MFITLLLTPCKPKLVDYVLQNQLLDILKKYDFNEFWSLMAQKSISEETFKANCGVNNQHQSLLHRSQQKLV